MAGNHLEGEVGAEDSFLVGQAAYLEVLVAYQVVHSYCQEEVEGQEASPCQEAGVAFPYLEVEAAFPFLEVEVAFPYLEVEEEVSHLTSLRQGEEEGEVLNRPYLEEEVEEEAFLAFLEEGVY